MLFCSCFVLFCFVCVCVCGAMLPSVFFFFCISQGILDTPYPHPERGGREKEKKLGRYLVVERKDKNKEKSKSKNKI